MNAPPQGPRTTRFSDNSQSQRPYSPSSSPEYDENQNQYTHEKYNPDNMNDPTSPTSLSQLLDLQSRPMTTASTLFNLDAPIMLIEYRILMGMSPDPGMAMSPPPADTIYPRLLPFWLRKFWRKEDKEAPTSIYYSVLGQETTTMLQYHLFEIFVSAAYILQLVLSACLIILGAVPVKHTVAITVLSATNGIIAGLLSLVKGQGLPMRLMKYAESLRVIRDEIEWKERQLRANLNTVSYRDVFKLRRDYETVRDTEVMNSPDVWQTNKTTPPSQPAVTANSSSKSPSQGALDTLSRHGTAKLSQSVPAGQRTLPV